MDGNVCPYLVLTNYGYKPLTTNQWYCNLQGEWNEIYLMVVSCQMTFENKLEGCHFGATWLGIIYCAFEDYGNKLTKMGGNHFNEQNLSS